MNAKQLVLLGMGAFALAVNALTVEKMMRMENGDVCAELAYESVGEPRHVIVAWGATAGGGTYDSWERAEYALGVAGGGSTSTRVTVPKEAAEAARSRFFLIPAGAAPEYVRSDGSQYIRTDFHPSPNSCVVADYRWEDTTKVQQRIVGVKAGLNVHHYINGSGGLAWSFSNGGNWTAFNNDVFKADKARGKITLDGKNKRVTFLKDGVQIYSATMSGASPGTAVATVPLNILANGPGSTDPRGVARIYAVTLSDDEVLKHDFVPAFDGYVAGLRDVVTGKFYKNTVGRPFAAGAPTPAVAASDSSAEVVPATELAKPAMSLVSAGGADLSFASAAAAREIWCVWDDEDKGDDFTAWANNERVTVLAPGATFFPALLPPRAIATGARFARFFILSPDSDYPCTYIRGDGRQAIDSGIVSGNGMAATIDFFPNNIESVQQRQFGVNDATDGFTFASYYNGGGKYAWAAKDHTGNWTDTVVYPECARTTVTLDVPNDLYTLNIGGVERKRIAISPTVPAANSTVEKGKISLTFLAAKTSSGTFTHLGQLELYGATVSTNGVLARSFVPCVAGGVPGARDSVTGEFFGNCVTNDYTQFIPGGRTDAPIVQTAFDTIDLRTVSHDVFADARFWLRGMGEDADGDGALTRGTGQGELRDALGRWNPINEVAYGADGCQAYFTNEYVRLPGRGVGRMMQTLHFPQKVVITNAADNSGYVCPASFYIPKSIESPVTNRWTVLVRARADLELPPANNTQWLMRFGYSAKNGFMFGFTGSDPGFRSLAFYSSNKSLTNDDKLTGIVQTNGWFDYAVIADGQKIKLMYMRDGDVLNGDKGDVAVGMQTRSRVVEPTINLTPAQGCQIYFGAEAGSNGKRPYPMGSNDNSIKAFRGSVQQLAVWTRALSDREVAAAMGWPRTDLFRVGVENGTARELGGEAPSEGVAADDETWPIRNGVTRTKPLTIKFPLDGDLETKRGQIFRWKSLPGSSEGRLEVAVNGHNLGRKTVRPGKTATWFVDAAQLVAGTNTAVISRVDNGTGALVPDVVALGGGVQVGLMNGSFDEFVQESCGLKPLYAGDGNLHDVRRVLYCGKQPQYTNLPFHVTLPAEYVNPRQKWLFTLRTASASLGAGMTSHSIGIDLNGTTLDTREMAAHTTYTFNVAAEDVLPGVNIINMRNNTPDIGNNYLGIDYFSFEPLRPIDGTIFLLR